MHRSEALDRGHEEAKYNASPQHSAIGAGLSEPDYGSNATQSTDEEGGTSTESRCSWDPEEIATARQEGSPSDEGRDLIDSEAKLCDERSIHGGRANERKGNPAEIPKKDAVC